MKVALVERISSLMKNPFPTPRTELPTSSVLKRWMPIRRVDCLYEGRSLVIGPFDSTSEQSLFLGLSTQESGGFSASC